MHAVLEAANSHLDQSLRRRLARAALDAGRDNPNVRAAQDFVLAVDALISIKGFRKPSAAPTNRLAQEVGRRMETAPQLTYGVLVLWTLSKPDLCKLALGSVHGSGIPTDIVEIAPDLSAVDVATAVGKQVEAIQEAVPGLSKEELWLAVLTVMYLDFERASRVIGEKRESVGESGHQAEGPPEGEPEEALAGLGRQSQDAATDAAELSASSSPAAPDCSELESALLKGWLTELADLDCDAAEWRQTAEFLEQVELMAARKREEADRVRAVEPALVQLRSMRDEHADALAGFGRELLPETDWPDTVLTALSTSPDRLAELGTLLAQYSELLSMPTTRIRSDRQQRRDLEVRLESDIDDLLRGLPNDLWHDSHGEAEESSEAAPLSDGEGRAEGTAADPAVADARDESDVVPRGVQAEEGIRAGAGVEDGATAGCEKADAPGRDSDDAEGAEGSAGTEDEEDNLDADDTGAERPDRSEQGGPDDTSESLEDVGATALGDPSLCASCDIAEELVSRDEDALWHRFAVSLVAEGDAPGAYWVTRSLEQRGVKRLIPSWLLAAYQGAIWLSTDSPLSWDLAAIVAENDLPTDETSRLLALTVSVKSVLVEPQTGMAAWLQDAASVAQRFGLSDPVNAVRQYAEQCALAVRPEYLAGIVDEEAREEAIKAASDEARGWMERAQLLQAGYQRATAVWRRLLSKDGDLGELMAPVLRDTRSAIAVVRKAASNWRNGEHVDRRVAELVDEMYGGGADEIEAHAAVWLRRRAAETSACALRWCDVAGDAKANAKSLSWGGDYIEELREAVEAWLIGVPELLGELSGDATARGQLTHTCVQDLAAGLAGVLRLESTSGAASRQDTGEAAWWTADSDSLEGMLAKRLLWCPEVELLNDCRPSDSGFAAIAGSIRDGVREMRTLRDATAMWATENRDYRFLDRYLTGGLSPLADDEEFVEQIRKLQSDGLAELRDQAGRASECLEQAVVDDVLDETERASYDAQLQDIAAPLTGDGPVENSYHVGQHLAVLDRLTASVEARRREHLKDLTSRWSSVHKLMLRDYPVAEAGPVIDLVEKALTEPDIVLLNECIPVLERTVKIGASLEPERFIAPAREDVLEAFNESRDGIRTWARASQGLKGVLEVIDSKRQKAGIRFGELSDPTHKEVLRAVTAWGQIKRAKGSKEEALKHLPTLTQYLGFEMVRTGGPPISVKAGKADWLHAHASLTAGDRARPIPLYGSKSKNRYDLVCLWERPGMVSLGSRIQELGIKNRPVIVFYMGHLSDRQRLDLVQSTRSRNMPVAVLDETLLLFLARCRDIRLSDFLACAIPYVAVNPYTPGVAGNVPPEMYFGREQMADELENQHGSCLVYGGRQLGKSALLRRVAARFNRPEDEQYAAVHEIKLVGDRLAGEDASGIWRHLHEVMSALDLVDRKYKSPEDLINTVREVMDAVPERRVIVLFDEADKFLHDDSRGNYSQLSRLKALMEDTDRRFKLVFAGLQEVQRFKQLPNHPLAHLGESIQVGAMQPSDARKLVRGPTDVLGFRMSNPVVLRILSYTNYHPGLLQLFCSALVERLQKKPIKGLPPYDVLLEDVELVRQELRKEIRKRFDWTLELDPRYQAIAWSMIADQLERSDGYSKAYTSMQILDLARSWWAAGFEGVQGDSMGALLTELCGLNILVEEKGSSGSGPYRLRSPNLVRLMGRGADLETRLLELSESPSSAEPADLDAISLWIDGADGDGFFSPLTRAQEGQVAKPASGFSIVHGSEALGLARQEAAVRALIPRDLPSAEFAVSRIPASATTGDAVRRWLREFVRRHHDQTRLITWTTLGGEHAPTIGDVLGAAASFCESRRVDDRQWLKVLIFLDPMASVVWLDTEPEARRALEERADVVTWLRPLPLAGIAQRLNRVDMMSSEEDLAAILHATGGWPLLVDSCVSRAKTGGNPVLTAEKIASDLMPVAGEPWCEFERSAGLSAIASWSRLFKKLSEWLPLSEREIAALTADDVDWDAWQGYDTAVLLRRLGLLRVAGNGLLAVDGVVKRSLGSD